MHRIHKEKRLVALLCLGLASLASHATDRRWVHGSWVNLRAEPSAEAKVVTQVVTNTEIKLHAQRGEWCDISTIAENVHGFIVCRLIGEKPLTPADLGQPRNVDGTPNPNYSHPRAFWMVPTVGTLLEAGDYYWRTMLNESQRASEQPDNYPEPGKEQVKPKRFPIPEFEAMKERMQKGVVAPKEARPAIIAWSTLKNAKPEPGQDHLQLSGRWIDGNLYRLIQSGSLVPVKSSLFKQVTEIAPASSSVEQLSAQFGIVEQVKILSGAEWRHHRHVNPRVFGHWDIGSLQVSMQRPVIEYAIGRPGLASASQWRAEETQDYKADYNCVMGFALAQRAKIRLPDYPHVKDPLVWFYLPAALPYKKVNIQTRARRLEPSNEKQGFAPKHSLIVMRDIDIDGDGVPDITAWEVMGSGVMDAPPDGGDIAIARIVFANIAGEWHLLDLETYGECT